MRNLQYEKRIAKRCIIQGQWQNLFAIFLSGTDVTCVFTRLFTVKTRKGAWPVYSRVWNKRTPLNKRSPLENMSKRIIVAPFLPYTMKSGIRP